MTPERFRRIEELYHAARKVTPKQRDALLAGVEPAIRSEVELLLQQRSDDSFWENLAAATLSITDAPTITAFGEGSRLGRYLVESKLGHGGMGDVYRAVDTRLGRTIAIKTTREQFSARFEREARAISALNHPHICTLHDVGPNYLVMELVEGETLAARLKRGPLPLADVLLYGSQIAAALAEAHAKGVVHRDLKPGNIMIGKPGVKVLDFGLARTAQDDTLTASHAVMGTPAYMAPEQLDGKAADRRTDIYALGLVLYEMATGVRFGMQPARVRPRQLERIISRCLEAAPDQRWQSVALVEQQLKTLRPSKLLLYTGIAVALMVAAGVAGGYYMLHRGPKLSVKDSVVLADFINKTGDPVFDQTLRQGLAVQLEQSPYLRLISDRRIHQILRFMNKPSDTRLTSEVSREICERTGSAALLEGSISSLGSQYILWLGAKSCRSGDTLAEEQTEVKIKEEVLGGLSRIAAQIRTRLGESLASVQELSTPLEQATTPSLDALRAYTAARNSIYTQGGAAAIPHLQQAIAIDPQFAMAHAT